MKTKGSASRVLIMAIAIFGAAFGFLHIPLRSTRANEIAAQCPDPPCNDKAKAAREKAARDRAARNRTAREAAAGAERDESRSTAARKKLDADFARAMERGGTYFTQQRYPEAVEQYKEAIRLKPNEAKAHNYLGRAYYGLKQFKEAIVEYKETIRLKPDFASGHNNLGYVYVALKRYDEAVREFKEAIRLGPGTAAEHNGLGNAYFFLNQFNEAIVESKEAIRLQPDLAVAHFNLGRANGSLQRYSDAIREYKEAIRLKPNYPEANDGLASAHYNFGVTWFESKRYNEAIEQYKEAVRLKPDHAQAHYSLGMSYLLVNNRQAAMGEYRVLQQLKSDYADKLLLEINTMALAFTGRENYQFNGKNLTRYKLSVTNRASYPNERFAPAPDLPPCGRNTNASRTWVDVFDGDGKRLTGFCALKSSEDLASLWFSLPEGEAPPASVFIVLTDRRTNAKYKSTLAAIP